jgi:glucosamine--fructose-6-phosphate aminotransferase (isomerizing)
MCGIIACITENCNHDLFEGILQLKNRGYDSVGIATLNQENEFRIDKFASSIDVDAYKKISSLLDHHNDTKIGIAHTRWATHGAKTDFNSHPHKSNCGKFVLVHNGIIENYLSLKNNLEKQGYQFQSQTDSEVIVQQLSYLYKTNKNIKECILKLIGQLEGTWGLAILCIDEPNSIFCIRHGSPLLIGYDDKNAIIVSEQSGFCNKIQNYFVLENHDLCKISSHLGKIIIDTTSNYIPKNLSNLEFDLTPDPFPHWTLKEIHEQKDSSLRAISMGGRLLDDNQVKLGGLSNYESKLMEIDHLILLGCGTSYFAAQHGLFFLKDLCDFNTVQLFDGAEFSSKDIPKVGKTALLLISQSGETKDLHRCIEIGKQNNLFLIGLVNVVDSLISREVNCGCYLNAGREVGVASTKAYSSQVILLSLIAVWFAQKKELNENKRKDYIRDLRKLSHDIEQTLSQNETKIEDIIEKLFTNRNHCFLLGKGKSESVAKEGSLKIKEISYIHFKTWPVCTSR